MSVSPVTFTVHRQAGPKLPARVEHFSIAVTSETTVGDALHGLSQRPVTAEGTSTSPVLFDDRCSAPLCGSCVMLINGWPRAACATRVSTLEGPVVLAPLPGFPVVRDLWVDRQELHAALIESHAWVPVGWEPEPAPAPRVSPLAIAAVQRAHACTECGACQSACPSMGHGRPYRGPAVMHALHALLHHPTVALQPGEISAQVTADPGIAGCNQAGNCQAVCPQQLVLTQDLGALERHASRTLLQVWLMR